MELLRKLAVASATASLTLLSASGHATSHMDAPLITLDDAANTTDVYAFVSEQDGDKGLVVGLGVYPFEEPGIGPNKYNFDDNVLYEIHVALGDDVQRGRKTVSYQFRFNTEFQNENTILQSYTGVVAGVDADNPDPNQNLIQRYSVTKVDRRAGTRTQLGRGIVPPNNQGRVTPLYNQDEFGDAPAKDGVASVDALDPYTAGAIAHLSGGYVAFAGQRDDGFYADVQGVFDALALGNAFDSQGGFNIHLMVLHIPMSELGDDQQVAGVYATTSRRQISILTSNKERRDDRLRGGFIQVARQGNPLFNEALVPIVDKDLYSRTSPTRDRRLFSKYAENPELARLLNALVVPGSGLNAAVETERSDIAGIFIPDVIKVDLSTPAACLAGSGPNHPTNPDDECFSRLSIFGGDVLQSQIQDPFLNGGLIPGGWPNGRRFGDDVLDIAVSALLSDLRTAPLAPENIQVVGDGVDQNDIGYNKVFPYEGTPHNGRVHAHHGEPVEAL